MSDWIDITRTLSNGMVHWPGDPPFHWKRVQDITGPGTGNLSEIHTGVHIGTHIDAPLHFIAGGQDIAEVALDRLCGPASVVEITSEADVSVEDLEAAEIPAGDRVLLKTSGGALWDQPEFSESFVGVSGDAAMWLVDRGAPAVGIDYLSVDGFHSREHPAHYALLANGVIIIEGLDLGQVEPGRYEMIALPLKIAGSEASPARVIIRPLEEKKRSRRSRKDRSA